MTFTEAISSGFENYATFEGRSTRSAYWYWFLFGVLVGIVAAVVDNVVGTAGVIGGLASLALLIPGLAVGARRLHDIDKSGWNWLWVLVPILGAIYLIYLFVQPGTVGANQYGMETS